MVATAVTLGHINRTNHYWDMAKMLGKFFAAADADAGDADAAETDWKHKVTPELGDLIRY